VWGLLTEIHLCHACFCQEILRMETARQVLAAQRSEAGAPAREARADTQCCHRAVRLVGRAVELQGWLLHPSPLWHRPALRHVLQGHAAPEASSTDGAAGMTYHVPTADEVRSTADISCIAWLCSNIAWGRVESPGVCVCVCVCVCVYVCVCVCWDGRGRRTWTCYVLERGACTRCWCWWRRAAAMTMTSCS
jgi:hypothetical protein